MGALSREEEESLRRKGLLRFVTGYENDTSASVEPESSGPSPLTQLFESQPVQAVVTSAPARAAGRGIRGTLDTLDAVLGAPSRGAIGGINAAIKGKPVVEGAWQSFTREKPVHGSELLETLGVPENPESTLGKVGKFAGGLAIDILVDPLLGPLGASVGGLTKAGKAASKVATWQKVKELEALAKKADLAGDATKAAGYRSAVEKSMEESGRTALFRKLGNALGSENLSTREGVELLRAREAAGLPTGLKYSLSDQAAAGQRKAFRALGDTIQSPQWMDDAMMGGLEKVGKVVKDFTFNTPYVNFVPNAIYRSVVDPSGWAGTMQAERRNDFANEAMGRWTKDRNTLIAEEAKKLGITDAHAPQVTAVLDEPFVEVRKLGLLNRQGEALVEKARAAGVDIKVPEFSSLESRIADLTSARDKALAAGRNAEAAILDKKLATKVADRGFLLESPASFGLAALERALTKTPHPTLKAELDNLQAIRDPLVLKVESGVGLTPVLNTDDPVWKIAQMFRNSYDEIYKREHGGILAADSQVLVPGFDLPTPALKGRQGYATRVLTPKAQALMDARDESHLFQDMRESTPLHKSMEGRDLNLRDFTTAELQGRLQSGELAHYGGIKPADLPGDKILSDDPFYAFSVRGARSGKAQGGATFLDEIAQLGEQQIREGLVVPGPGKTKRLDTYPEFKDLRLPAETRRRLKDVELPIDQAEYVAKKIGLVTDSKKPNDFWDQVGKVLTPFTQFWKSLATQKPAFVSRNTAGMYLQNYLEGLTDFKPYMEADKLAMMSAKQLEKYKRWVPTAGREMNGLEIVEQATRDGISPGVYEFGDAQRDLYQASDVPWAAKERQAAGPRLPEFLGERFGGGANIFQAPRTEDAALGAWGQAANVAKQIPLLGTENPYRRAITSLNNAAEYRARMAQYLHQLDMGTGFREAGDVTRKLHFDYGEMRGSNLTNILPFWRWMRGNIPLQLETLLMHPSKIANQVKALIDIEDQMEPLSKQEEYIASVGKGEGRMPINLGRMDYTNRKGENERVGAVMSLSGFLPMSDVGGPVDAAAEFFNERHLRPEESLFDTGKRALSAVSELGLTRGVSAVNPLLTAPYALATNRNPYTRKPIDPVAEIGKMFPDTRGMMRPKEEAFLGGSISAGKSYLANQWLPTLADVDRLNPGDMFGTRGNGGWFSDVKRTRMDAPESMRWLQYVLGPKLQPVGSREDREAMHHKFEEAKNVIDMAIKRAARNKDREGVERLREDRNFVLKYLRDEIKGEK